MGDSEPYQPTAEELTQACKDVKAANPEFGIKRVYTYLKEEKKWNVSEKRVKGVRVILCALGDTVILCPILPPSWPRSTRSVTARLDIPYRILWGGGASHNPPAPPSRAPPESPPLQASSCASAPLREGLKCAQQQGSREEREGGGSSNMSSGPGR